MFKKDLAADGSTGGSGEEGQQNNGGQNPQKENQQNQSNQSQQAPDIDYEKLASIISGKQSVTEDTILKNYFKQQGLSQEEAQKAIQSFKEQKAKNQPDVAAMQTQITQYQQEVQKAAVENAAMMEAMTLGMDAKTIPYVLKLADLSGVVGTDGKINQETLKNALNKVLEDVPQLKPSEESGKGFQFGGIGGNAGGNGSGKQSETKPAVATKRWNRFN